MTNTPLLTFISCSLAFAGITSAATVAIDSSTQSTTVAGSTYANGVGHRFQVNSANLAPGQSIVVAQLGTDGFFGTTATPAGIVVKLWDASNATAPLATVTFTGSETFSVVDYAHGGYDGRRYLGDIAPLTLTSGTTYIIAAYGYHGSGATEASYINGATGQTVAPQITFLQEVYSGAAGGLMPTTVDGAAGVFKYGGPTFGFNVVPEPSAALLAGLSILGFVTRRRR